MSRGDFPLPFSNDILLLLKLFCPYYHSVILNIVTEILLNINNQMLSLFYRLSHNRPEVLKTWLEFIGVDAATLHPAARICSDHFHEQSFVHRTKDSSQFRRLKLDATPTRLVQAVVILLLCKSFSWLDEWQFWCNWIKPSFGWPPRFHVRFWSFNTFN